MDLRGLEIGLLRGPDPGSMDWLGLVLAVLPFALSTTLTPGPNTILVTASAATSGSAAPSRSCSASCSASRP